MSKTYRNTNEPRAISDRAAQREAVRMASEHFLLQMEHQDHMQRVARQLSEKEG